MEELTILELKKQLNETHNKLARQGWFTLIAVLFIIAIVVWSVNRPTDTSVQDQQIQDIKTAIEVQKAADSIIVRALNSQDTVLRKTTNIIYNRLLDHDNMLTNISHRYDKKRTTVNALSDTDQLRLLSDNITSGH